MWRFMFTEIGREELFGINGGHYPPSERDAVSTPETEREGRRSAQAIVWGVAGGTGTLGKAAAVVAGIGAGYISTVFSETR